MDRLPHAGILVVRSGRTPHTICLALGLVAITCYGVVVGTPSVSIDSGLNAGQRYAFGGCAFVGSALLLFGIYSRRPLPGMQIERVGQVLLATGAVTYVVTLLTISEFARAGLTVTIAAAIAAGSIWRLVQITQDVKLLREAGR